MKINKILNGDALAHLKELPSESIDCVVTSPPYWALRDYGKSVQSIWDAKEDCEHDFQIKERHIHRGSTNVETSIHGAIHNENLKVDWKTSDGFCLKCNAWKGQLGLEPTFELFIKHLCDIFDEVKRVLKKSGTCWVNLGDTYVGGGGGGSKYGGQFNSQEADTNPANFLNRYKGYPHKSLAMIPFGFAQ